MNTICNVLLNTRKGDDFYLLLGDFLDEFYRSNKTARQLMIDDPPCENAMNNTGEHLSFAAATAHKLANDYFLNIPEWVFCKQFYMTEKPHFGCRAKGSMRLLFMYKSPTEFKHRNLFVDENVLVRV
ncbi:MAG: hypothetical protein FWH14_05850 [Oscillospiraceae bacterium]|nr:hypothetical protein [Oscillospiraceae bacterium]